MNVKVQYFCANRHLKIHIVLSVGYFWWSLMTIGVLPIAGRPLTDSLNFHCYCSLVYTMYSK